MLMVVAAVLSRLFYARHPPLFTVFLDPCLSFSHVIFTLFHVCAPPSVIFSELSMFVFSSRGGKTQHSFTENLLCLSI